MPEAYLEEGDTQDMVEEAAVVAEEEEDATAIVTDVLLGLRERSGVSQVTFTAGTAHRRGHHTESS